MTAIPRAWASLTLWLTLLCGCPTTSLENAAPDHDDPFGNPIPLAECSSDDQCEPAASGCCECPSFALPVADGFGQTCADVGCDTPAGCPAVRAICASNSCTLRCATVICNTTCTAGFASTAQGCLTCSCASPPPEAPECLADTDCTRVPADCCGCTRGGEDTAVPASEAEAHIEALDCPAEPACPDVDTCADDSLPRCIQGRCSLAPAEPPPDTADEPQRCGTTSLPPCPQDRVCVLNDPAAPEATAAGVGVCRDPDTVEP